jgi:hypothetical protein
VQVTVDPNNAKVQKQWASDGVSGTVWDVELDDGHVYSANFTHTLEASTKEMTNSLGPDTGDKVELCALTATDGTRHYNLHVKGEHYAATLLR